MRISPLAERVRASGGYFGPYAGGNVRLDGGETAQLEPWPAEQLLLYDVSWRAHLGVEGPEVRKWLNGMITANVRDLAPGQWVPSFQLDPKGHILAAFDVVCLGPDRFLLLTDEEQRAGLDARLRRYVFMAKLAITDTSEQEAALCLRGPHALAAAERARLGTDGMRPGEARALQGEEILAIRGERGGVAELEFWTPSGRFDALWTRLLPLALPAGSTVWERDRILSRSPRYGVDITEAELPQETGQSDHLDFTKGCYIGQEIVERIRARGAVHRHWTALALAAAVEPGTALRAEGKEIGRVTSLTRRGDGWLALGYVRDPHAVAGAELDAGGVAARVEATVEAPALAEVRA